MTGMSDLAWQRVKDVGAQVSIAFPIEMNMRHGMPPILKMQSLGMEPSLSSDVESTMTADFFTQMRSAMTMQRMVVNQMILEQGDFTPPNQWPTPAPGTPPLLNVRDVLRFATINGAKHLRLDGKTGSLTPGKEADIIILDATHINVAPLNNVPGAVVSLMDRTNVETVIVAGKVRKWKGKLLDVDLRRVCAASSRTRATTSSARRASRRTCSGRTSCSGRMEIGVRSRSRISGLMELEPDPFINASSDGRAVRLQRGCGVRGWGRDGLGTGARGRGARARRALMSTTRRWVTSRAVPGEPASLDVTPLILEPTDKLTRGQRPPAGA